MTLLEILFSVGSLFATIGVPMVAAKFRHIDNRHHDLAKEVHAKPEGKDVKEIVQDKLEPIRVLLSEIKEDIQELKSRK